VSKSAKLEYLKDQLSQYRIVDAHQHLGSWGSFGGFGSVEGSTWDMDTSGRFDFMSAWGIDQALIHPNQQSGSDPSAVSRFNDNVLEAHDKCLDRFPGAVASLPLTSEADINLEFNRISSSSICGLSFHHRFIAKPLNHPLMETVSGLARGKGWPIIVHCVAESTMTAMWRLSALARRFPDVKYLALTAFSGPTQAQQCLEVAIERPNIYFETALMMPNPTFVEEFCRVAGPERLLFGTDLYVIPHPIYNCPTTLFELLSANIPGDAKQRILAQNAEELFKLPSDLTS
jgi:uncharacterized protein